MMIGLNYHSLGMSMVALLFFNDLHSPVTYEVSLPTRPYLNVLPCG